MTLYPRVSSNPQTSHKDSVIVVTVHYDADDNPTVETFVTEGGDPSYQPAHKGLLAVSAMAVILVAIAAGSALTARLRTMDNLSALETLIGGRLKTVQGPEHDAQEARALNAYGAPNGNGDQIRDDLLWIAHNKANGAPFSSLSWDPGTMTIVGPYPQSPFANSDRAVTPSALPPSQGHYGYSVAALKIQQGAVAPHEIGLK